MSTHSDGGTEAVRHSAGAPRDFRLPALLAGAGRIRLLCLIAVLLLRSLAPVGATLATMAVVSRLAVPGGAKPGALGPSFIALAGALLLSQIAAMLTEPLEFAVRREVDGLHRREVGATALAGGLERLEDPAFRDDLLLAAADPANWTERSPGSAAVAQLLRLTKWLGALAAACVVARYNVAAASGLLAVLTLQNMLMRRQWHRMTQVWADGAAHLRRAAYWTDVTTGAPSAKELRLFGFADWVLTQYDTSISRHLIPFRAAKFALVRRQWIPFVGIWLAMAWALWTLAEEAARGRLDAAALSGAAVAAWSLFSIGATGPEILDVEGGKIPYAALLRLREAGSGAAATQAAAKPRSPQPPSNAQPPVIRFESVGFHYPGLDRMVLDGLDLTLRPGETLAVVGLNGTGKSTLIKLLAGLYEPTAGRITADGVDLRDLGPGAWYQRISVVFQDFIHYGMSLRENIALGMSDQPAPAGRREAAFARAAADLGIHEIAGTLPQGWDTVLQAASAGGSDLSGGQWQRVALARALSAVYAGVRVLVLDEPTAHLDVRTEMEVFDEILGLTAGVSTVIVSHRLSTVRKADRIVLLDQGRVTESGTHAELMALRGGYHELFRMQADRFAAAAPRRGAAESAGVR